MKRNKRVVPGLVGWIAVLLVITMIMNVMLITSVPPFGYMGGGASVSMRE